MRSSMEGLPHPVCGPPPLTAPHPAVRWNGGSSAVGHPSPWCSTYRGHSGAVAAGCRGSNCAVVADQAGRTRRGEPSVNQTRGPGARRLREEEAVAGAPASGHCPARLCAHQPWTRPRPCVTPTMKSPFSTADKGGFELLLPLISNGPQGPSVRYQCFSSSSLAMLLTALVPL